MFVYLVTNNINGKQYVGQHSGNNLDWYWRRCIRDAIGERKRLHKPNLYNAIRKHGVENFSIVPLVIVGTKEEMDLYEKGMIKALNTKRPNGYNLTDGGDGTLGRKMTPKARQKLLERNKNNKFSLGTKMPEEHRLKLIRINTGSKRTDEIKVRMAEAHRGLKHTEEAKKKIAAAHLGKKRSPAGVLAHHKFWHVNKGIINPKCRFCQEAQNVLVNKPQLQTDRTTLETTPQQKGHEGKH